MNRNRQEKGITLIALVITIIILLILAGISIASLIGNDGLINKAKMAKEKSEKASIIEQIQTDIMAKQAESMSTDLSQDELKEILNKYVEKEEDIKYDETDTSKIASIIAKNGNYEILLSDVWDGKTAIKKGSSGNNTENNNAGQNASSSEIAQLKSEIEKLNSIVNEMKEGTTGNKTYSVLDKIYPIGSIYMSANISTVEEMEEKIGGKWERYGEGRTIVGSGTGLTAGTTGGSPTATLTTANIPSHTHSIPALSGTTDTDSMSGGMWGFFSGTWNPNGMISVTKTDKPRTPYFYTATTEPSASWMEIWNRWYYFSHSHSHNVTTSESTSGSTRFREFI